MTENTKVKKSPLDVVILSGMSGSGKSSALNILEDAGYFAIDNLPGELLPHLLPLLGRRSSLGHIEKIALVMDARERNFAKKFEQYFRILKSRTLRLRSLRILFFDARDDVLLRRFSETRRRHPLAPSGRVSDGIRRERDLLQPIREASTRIIDTSRLNVHELRARVLKIATAGRTRRDLAVTIVSFGYRFGLPLEADIVMDLRFLPNPHFIPHLRPLSGRNPRVAAFVLRQPETADFLKSLRSLLALLLRQYKKEGKAYLTIAFGCTGGRHRSVVLSENIGRNLKLSGHEVKIFHRDLSRGN